MPSGSCLPANICSLGMPTLFLSCSPGHDDATHRRNGCRANATCRQLSAISASATAGTGSSNQSMSGRLKSACRRETAPIVRRIVRRMRVESIRAETAVSAMSVLGWLRRLLHSTIVDGISTIRPKSASKCPITDVCSFSATSIRASSAGVNSNHYSSYALEHACSCSFPSAVLSPCFRRLLLAFRQSKKSAKNRSTPENRHPTAIF